MATLWRVVREGLFEEVTFHLSVRRQPCKNGLCKSPGAVTSFLSSDVKNARGMVSETESGGRGC